MTEGSRQVAYRSGVRRLLADFHAVPRGAPIRLAKPTSNLFRARRPAGVSGLDTSGLRGVLAVDPVSRTAEVAGMCSYETLLEETLRHGLAPLVVPQLKTITVGGAVTGLGIESTSFRNGLPHESVLEMDVLTGAGEIVTASRDEHPDLYRAFPNSYGTLGYSLRLRLELEAVQPYVALRHMRFGGVAELIAAMDDLVRTRTYDGMAVDYLDGVVFSAGESYLCLGTQTSAGGPVSDYTGQRIYYRSIRQKPTDRLTVGDYLWRWDTDWFWCSRAFGAQNAVIRRLWPARYRRSSVYWKLVALDRRLGIGDRIEAARGRPPRERVVQDVEIPIRRCAEFLGWFFETVPITPIWLCPLRLRDPGGWPLYPLETGGTYVNVGFWSSVPTTDPDSATANRSIEAMVDSLGGHKSLYSDSFYQRAEFDRLYGGDTYRYVKKSYDPDARLPDLYEKAVLRR